MSHSRAVELLNEAKALHPWLIEHRRNLHRQPELSFQEERTSAYLWGQAVDLGLTPVAVREDRYGFYCDLQSPQNPEEFVVLRADMDALPIEEQTGLSFSSERPGVGHLCGHDSHSAMLLGAARMLSARRQELPVSVRFFFQHAEELPPGGAIDFVRAGALENVRHCFGLHVSPLRPVGTLAVRTGPQMAGATRMVLTVKGRGGHASRPQDAADPVLASSAIVLALQQIVSRRMSPIEATVVSVCSIHAGSAHNVIPEEVVMEGTTRAYSRKRLVEMADLIRQIALATATAYGCEVHLEMEEGYPPLENDEAATAMMRESARRIMGDDSVCDMEPSMGGEDFAYYCIERPSSFAFIGAAVPGSPYYPLHHPRFHPDEEVLWRGSAVLAEVPFIVGEHIRASAFQS